MDIKRHEEQAIAHAIRPFLRQCNVEVVGGDATSIQYLNEVLDKIETGEITGEMARYWLGWVQGVVCCRGGATADEMDDVKFKVMCDVLTTVGNTLLKMVDERERRKRAETRQPASGGEMPAFIQIADDGGGAEHVAVTPAGTAGFKCMDLQKGVKVLPRRPGVDMDVYDADKEMEHPAIHGLLLSREARAYGAYLEYVTPDGEVKTETPVQKNQRVKWEKPAGMAHSSTAHTFVKMNMANFKQ